MSAFRFSACAVALGGLLMASVQPGFAGAPGSGERQDGFAHICKSGPSRGSDCDPDDAAPCGTRGNGTPHACIIDALGKPGLRGFLTLIADESPADNVSLPGNPTITALLELTMRGTPYLFAKTFQSSDPGSWPEIAAWLAPTSESEIDLVVGASSWVYQSPILALSPFALAIDEAVESVWPSKFDLVGRAPIITEAGLAPKSDKQVDQFVGSDTGEVLRIKVRVQYVRLAP